MGRVREMTPKNGHYVKRVRMPAEDRSRLVETLLQMASRPHGVTAVELRVAGDGEWTLEQCSSALVSLYRADRLRRRSRGAYVVRDAFGGAA